MRDFKDAQLKLKDNLAYDLLYIYIYIHIEREVYNYCFKLQDTSVRETIDVVS